MHRFSASTVLVVLCSIPAQAQADQVRRGPVPEWVQPSSLLPSSDAASGPFFVRRSDTLVHFGPRGQEQYTGSRIRILQSSALQLGNISIAWNPVAGAPIIHTIKVYREGEVFDVLKTSSFEILRREDQLEAAQLTGVLTAVLRVPDLRVGDELEIELTSFASDPTLGRNDTGFLLLQPSPSPGRYRLGLSWTDGRKPNLKMTPDMASVARATDTTLEFRFDNPPPVSPPNGAPPRYQWQRVVEFSHFPDWQAVSRHFAPLYAKAAALAPASSIRREASRIAAAHSTPISRATAALKLVQQNVRYIYVGLNGGNFTPATAEETWQRRYGDCKGKTALLLALLSEMGIEAEPVLINSIGADDGLDQRLPTPLLFDHVLVRARIDGTTYWLDGTLPPVALPSTRLVYSSGWVLSLTARGRELEKLSWQPAQTPDQINLFEVDARAGFDKPAQIISTEIVRGLKGLQQQAQYSSVTTAQLLEFFRQRAVGDVWQSIDKVEWRYDERAGASILTISGTGRVEWDNDGDGERSLALAGGGFSPPEKRVRGPGQDQRAPFYTQPEYGCHATTVRLPTSTQPSQWSSKNSYDTTLFGRHYYRAWELRDGSVRMVRGSRIEQPEIDADVAQRDNGRIASFDNSMGWLTFSPKERKGSVGRGEIVPATYEIDWTSIDVPCLPARSTS